MARVVFTPWKEHSQLVAVRSQFYPAPQQPDLRAQACDTVHAWKLRGNLPHPVEATALLTDAVLHDDARQNSPYSIRATYSTAFCRFVTGLVDAKLPGQRKQTMFQRAIELGLPASFVELRHEATHREPPSLIVLRDAVQRALVWLWGFYWAGIAPCATDPFNSLSLDNLDSVESLRQLVATAYLPKKKKGRRSQQAELARRLGCVCSSSSRARLLSHALVTDAILIPEDRRLGDPMQETFAYWDPVLQMVHEDAPAFLTALADEMATQLALASADSDNTNNNARSEAIFLWLDHLLSSQVWQAHRAQLSLAYVGAVCAHHSAVWVNSLREAVRQHQKADTAAAAAAAAASAATAATHPESAKTESAAQPDDQAVLEQYGWTVPTSWDTLPLGGRVSY